MTLWLRILLLAGILLAPFVAGYFASPQLAAWLAERYAAELGLRELQIVAERPGLGTVRVRSVTANGEGYEATLTDASLSYSWSTLLKGRLESLKIAGLF